MVADRVENLRQLKRLDFLATPEKVDEAVRRIIATANPLQIILFGSRARGDHREDSDVDLGVILDAVDETEAYRRLPYSVLRGLRIEIDMIVTTKKRFDEHRPWINSVFNYMDKEGIVLYDRDHPERACKDAVRACFSGRGFPRTLTG